MTELKDVMDDLEKVVDQVGQKASSTAIAIKDDKLYLAYAMTVVGGAGALIAKKGAGWLLDSIAGIQKIGE